MTRSSASGVDMLCPSLRTDPTRAVKGVKATNIPPPNGGVCHAQRVEPVSPADGDP